MVREKTELEKSESHQDEARRLRYALFAIHSLDDIDEIKRVAMCAMAGKLHGHELPPLPDQKAAGVWDFVYSIGR